MWEWICVISFPFRVHCPTAYSFWLPFTQSNVKSQNKTDEFRYCIAICPLNKKVLLRERKRHTARRVPSTRHAVPVGGDPILLAGGTPPCWWGGGTPTCWGSPSCWQGGTLGTPHFDLGRGTPQLARWGSSPPPWVWTDRRLWKHNLPHSFEMRVVKSLGQVYWFAHKAKVTEKNTVPKYQVIKPVFPEPPPPHNFYYDIKLYINLKTTD